MSHIKNKNEGLHGDCVAINNYICSTCRKNYLALEVNPGITPELIDCDVDGCEGKARSLNYPIIEPNRNAELIKAAKYEFYRPETVKDPFELADLVGGVLRIRERTAVKVTTINMYREWRTYTQATPPMDLAQQHEAEAQIALKSKSKLYI